MNEFRIEGAELSEETRVALAETDISKPVWNQIAYQGTWKGHPAGAFSITAEDLDDIVKNFYAGKGRVVIDHDHLSEADPTMGDLPLTAAPGHGWVTELQVRDGQLWGLFDFLEPMKAYVKEGRYRYLSPAIRFGGVDQVSGKRYKAKLTSVAVVHLPFLEKLKPLMASDVAFDNLHTMIQDTIITCLKEIPKVDDDKSKTELAELKLTLKEKESAFEAVTKELSDLRSEVKAQKDAVARADVDRVFAIVKDQHKLSDANKEDLLTFRLSSPDSFARLYDKYTAQVAKNVPAHVLQRITASEPKPAPVPAKKSPRLLKEEYIKQGMSNEDATNKAFGFGSLE